VSSSSAQAESSRTRRRPLLAFRSAGLDWTTLQNRRVFLWRGSAGDMLRTTGRLELKHSLCLLYFVQARGWCNRFLDLTVALSSSMSFGGLLDCVKQKGGGGFESRCQRGGNSIGWLLHLCPCTFPGVVELVGLFRRVVFDTRRLVRLLGTRVSAFSFG
jgi:hypothetical protein